MSKIIPRGQADITCDAQEYHISIYVKEKVSVSAFFNFDIIAHISFLWPIMEFNVPRNQRIIAYVYSAFHKGELAKIKVLSLTIKSKKNNYFFMTA